jgi:hypothetical protein
MELSTTARNIGYAGLIPFISWGLAIQCFTLWLCFFVDSRSYPRLGLSHWLRMRLTLTVVAGVCLGIPALW